MRRTGTLKRRHSYTNNYDNNNIFVHKRGPVSRIKSSALPKQGTLPYGRDSRNPVAVFNRRSRV